MQTIRFNQTNLRIIGISEESGAGGAGGGMVGAREFI